MPSLYLPSTQALSNLVGKGNTGTYIFITNHKKVTPAKIPTVVSLSSTTIISDRDPYDIRAKYTPFHILVIGGDNSGKTTLLQRVCNTTEDLSIY